MIIKEEMKNPYSEQALGGARWAIWHILNVHWGLGGSYDLAMKQCHEIFEKHFDPEYDHIIIDTFNDHFKDIWPLEEN